jgi:hypothetical protein
MHRMRCLVAKVGLMAVIGPMLMCVPASAELIRPSASQSFPDLSGDIVGTQTYTYSPSSGTGVFQVHSAPSLLAMGPQQSSETYVEDLPDQPRSQSLAVTLDPTGHLVSSAANTYSLYGTVTVNGQTLAGLLLQGTPTAFGFAPPDPSTPTMSVYDVNIALTGGLLKPAYGPDAYMRVISETNSTFDGTFTRNFSGLKTLTNVRSYETPPVTPIPEPSTFAVLLACGGAGLLYRRVARVGVRDLGG